MTRGKPLAPPWAVRAAVLLAAELFENRAASEEASWRQVVSLADAHFLLSGHYHLWPQWPLLSEDMRDRVVRLLRHRSSDLAGEASFMAMVDDVLVGGGAEFVDAGNGRVVVHPHRDRLGQIDNLLGSLDDNARDRERTRLRRLRPAVSNTFTAGMWVDDPGGRRREVTASYRIDVTTAPQYVPLSLGKPAELDDAKVPWDEVEAIAAALDSASGQVHRVDAVRAFRTHLRHRDGTPVGAVWELRAGVTQLLNAPTGVGKNEAIAEPVALWFAARGLVATVVVARNRDVMAAVYRLRRYARMLAEHPEAERHGWHTLTEQMVSPLMSTRRQQKFAEEVAASGTGDTAYRQWVYDELSYSCALSACASTETAVDTWDPGDEHCIGLSDPDGKAAACPWFAVCGKFRHHRAAATASILVVGHHNLYSGDIHVPVRGRDGDRSRIPVDELVLRRSHVVFADEIDALQSAGFDQGGRGVDLARFDGSRPGPVQTFAASFRSRAQKLPASSQANLHPAVAHLTWLADAYVFHLARGVLTPHRFRKAKRVMPRHWDAWFAHLLFDLPAETAPTQAQMQAVDRLFDARHPFEEGEHVEGVRDMGAMVRLQRRLSQLTDLHGFDLLHATNLEGIGAIARKAAAAPMTAAQQAVLPQHAVRRAFLENMRTVLRRIGRRAPQLRAAGIEADELLDVVTTHRRWRAAPFGPLGRPLIAFEEVFDPEDVSATRLQLHALAGDPHTYTATLGDVTALAYCGRRRIVVGLSASAFMPFASRHHLVAPLTWYVPDDVVSSITVRLAPVSSTRAALSEVVVSGREGAERAEALREMGRGLWRRFEAERANGDPARRDLYDLAAPVSYRDSVPLAEGMIDAGARPADVCVAVRPSEIEQLRVHPPALGWTPIPSDRLDLFPLQVPGRVLVAPGPLIERGLNFVDPADGSSLLRTASLAVRPIPVLDDPAFALSLVNSLAYRGSVKDLGDATGPDAPLPYWAEPGGLEPAEALRELRQRSGAFYEAMRGGNGYFRTLHRDIKLAIVAGMLVHLLQIGGRTRRGGAHGVLELIDAAFTAAGEASALPTLLGQLRERWAQGGELNLLQDVYASTLTDAIFGLIPNGSDTAP